MRSKEKKHNKKKRYKYFKNFSSHTTLCKVSHLNQFLNWRRRIRCARVYLCARKKFKWGDLLVSRPCTQTNSSGDNILFLTFSLSLLLLFWRNTIYLNNLKVFLSFLEHKSFRVTTILAITQYFFSYYSKILKTQQAQRERQPASHLPLHPLPNLPLSNCWRIH